MTLRDRLALGIVTAGGAGLSPKAPGTCGTLVALAIDAGLLVAGTNPVWLRWALAAGASLGCVALGGWCERHWQTKDPQAVVLDEVAGYFVAAALSGSAHRGWSAILCFALFRVFDIAKPFPVNRLQALPRGWGILLDDVAAGALAGGLALLILGWAS